MIKLNFSEKVNFTFIKIQNLQIEYLLVSLFPQGVSSTPPLPPYLPPHPLSLELQRILGTGNAPQQVKAWQILQFPDTSIQTHLVF